MAEGALRCVLLLGAREPAESTACRMRIMPICVLYVGVAWSTYTAVPHHDMSVCANADPCHQRVGAASSAQSGCATHHLTSLPNCPLPSNCWHRLGWRAAEVEVKGRKGLFTSHRQEPKFVGSDALPTAVGARFSVSNPPPSPLCAHACESSCCTAWDLQPRGATSGPARSRSVTAACER